jgi:deazaflavin-dependent oxidoreductase (nitroreductase family)
MRGKSRIPLSIWWLISRINRAMLSRYGAKSKVAGRVLVLTTRGRKTGNPRMTPLQYEEVENVYYVASARGAQADWYRNLQTCPEVNVRVGDRIFSTIAEPMSEPAQVADFLELRIKRHPHFMKAMMRLEGLPSNYSRLDLEKLARRLRVVALPKAVNPSIHEN